MKSMSAPAISGNEVTTRAAQRFIFTYNIHAAIAEPSGRIGHDQIAITNNQAWGLPPLSKAINDRGAITTQGRRVKSPTSCE